MFQKKKILIEKTKRNRGLFCKLLQNTRMLILFIINTHLILQKYIKKTYNISIL